MILKRRIAARLLVLATLFFGSGCASSGPQPDTSDRVSIVDLTTPPNFDRNVNALQELRVDYNDERNFLRIAIIASKQKVRMIVAAMHGPRLATIDWDDTGIHTQSGVINVAIENLEPEAILEDVVLVYWPEALVENRLTNNHKLRTESGKRIVESGGEEVVAIEYFDDDAWNGRTELNNYRYGYQLAIESQEVPVS